MSFVCAQDVGRRDTVIIYRFYASLWHVLTSSLHQPLAQHRLSRVRPIFPRDFPLAPATEGCSLLINTFVVALPSGALPRGALPSGALPNLSYTVFKRECMYTQSLGDPYTVRHDTTCNHMLSESEVRYDTPV